MKATVGTKRVLISIPAEVREWLEGRARYCGSTLSAEAVRSMRERMERESGARAAVAVAE